MSAVPLIRLLRHLCKDNPIAWWILQGSSWGLITLIIRDCFVVYEKMSTLSNFMAFFSGVFFYAVVTAGRWWPKPKPDKTP